MPAPRTRSGVVLRLLKETLLFQSLFRASKWTWLFGWSFHAGLVFTLLVHLRYLSDPTWTWVEVLIPYNKYFSGIMVFGLLGLLARRCFVDRVRYISTPSDYLMLIFLLFIPLSGSVMRVFTNTDYQAVTAFARGLVRFSPTFLSAHPVLIFHVIMVVVLLLVFPFSKLMHAPGLFFSPARNQRDNSRSDGEPLPNRSGESQRR